MSKLSILRKYVSFLVLVFVTLIACYAEGTISWVPSRILGLSYPQEARLARIDGTVEAKCQIRADGSVEDVSILSGHPVLARSIKSNLLKWTFKRSGTGTESTQDFRVTFSFQLKGSCDNHRGCKEEFWYDYPDRVMVVSELPTINTGKADRGRTDGSNVDSPR